MFTPFAHFRMYLRYDLHQMTAPGSRKDDFLIEKLRSECRRLERLIDISSTDVEYWKHLQLEFAAHAVTREELQVERRFRLKLIEINANLQRYIQQTRAAQTKLHQTLRAEQEFHQSTTAQLRSTVEWCYYVDDLIDVTLLEKNVALKLDDRVRQLPDIIFGIEFKMNAKYETRMKEKEDRIAQLEEMIKPENFCLSG